MEVEEIGNHDLASLTQKPKLAKIYSEDNASSKEILNNISRKDVKEHT